MIEWFSHPTHPGHFLELMPLVLVQFKTVQYELRSLGSYFVRAQRTKAPKSGSIGLRSIKTMSSKGFTMDFDERTDFGNLEPGIYNAVIHSADAEPGPTDIYLKLRFSVDNDKRNTQAWFNLSLANKALWRVRNLVRTLELTSGKAEYKDREEFVVTLQKMLIGQPVQIKIENEEFEGQIFDRVTKIMAPVTS